jgi:hypothetical protein
MQSKLCIEQQTGRLDQEFQDGDVIRPVPMSHATPSGTESVGQQDDTQ